MLSNKEGPNNLWFIAPQSSSVQFRSDSKGAPEKLLVNFLTKYDTVKQGGESELNVFDKKCSCQFEIILGH